MLVAATLLYSTLMAVALPTLLPRFFEPLSRRPEALRATWAAAAVLPLTPLAPYAAIPALLAASLLAYRGARLPASLLILAVVAFATVFAGTADATCCSIFCIIR